MGPNSGLNNTKIENWFQLDVTLNHVRAPEQFGPRHDQLRLDHQLEQF